MANITAGSLTYEFKAKTAELQAGMRAAQDQLRALNDNVRRNSEQFTRMGRDAQRAVGLTRSELVNLSRQIQDVGVSLAGGQSPFMVLIQQGAQIQDIFSSSGAGAGAALKGFAAQLASLVTPARVAGAAGAAAFATITAAAISAINASASLTETVKVLGTSFSGLRGLNQRGEVFGLDAKTMNAEMVGLAQRLSEAAREGGKLAEFMKANGIAIKDASGAARPFKEVFADIARVIASSGNEIDKLNALKLLGLSEEFKRVFEEAGADVQKFATDTRGEIDAWGAETRRRFEDLKADLLRIWSDIGAGVINYLAGVKSGALEVANAIQSAFVEVLRKIEEVIARARRAVGIAQEAVGLGVRPGFAEDRFRKDQEDIAKRRLNDALLAAEREENLGRLAGNLPPAGGAPQRATGGQQITFPANAEHAHKAAREAVRKHKEQVQELTEAQKQLNKAVKEFSDGIASALEDIIFRGKKAKDVLADLAKQLASSGIKSALSGGKDGGLFGGLLSAGANALGLAGGSGKYFSSPLFSGAPFKFMADGGTLGAGKWAITGEAGPELIQGPATVTPFDKMGGSPNIVIHNNAAGVEVTPQITPQGVMLMIDQRIGQNNRQLPGILSSAQRRRN